MSRIPFGGISPPTFEPFPKMARYSREVIVTEKIDGTNAQVYVGEDGVVRAGSRNRWLTPQQDNFGFAQWVLEHKAELRALGPGRHFGEWWGAGIQRRYGLKEKRFSLFNVARWADDNVRPACCHVVPVLWRGNFHEMTVSHLIDFLRSDGSLAAPGFMDPEGIVIFHVAAGVGFKKTIKDDEKRKGEVAP